MRGVPGSLRAYRALTSAIEPLAPALLRARARRGKEDPARIAERLGHTSLRRPPGRLVWLHGASVGESLSLLPLVQSIGEARPDVSVLVTSGTVTSAELLARRLPDGAMHQFAPIDGPRSVARFLDAWRPDLAVLVESELWPNLILQSQAAGTRLAFVSARLSPASLARWAQRPAAARRLLSAFDLVMAQDDATAEALTGLGARDDGRLNLKLAGAALPVDLTALEAARRAADGRPVLLAASTHPGEDAVVLQAFSKLADRPNAPRLVIVPRHPVRGAQIAGLVGAHGLSVTRQGAGEAFGSTSVFVADGLGELGLWFSLCRAAFVGGSLVPGVGGHNPLEPARLGAPVITGPHIDNWRSIYGLMEDAVAQTDDAASLADAFVRCLDDPAAAAERAERARSLAGSGDAAAGRAASKLLALIR